jgi:hypothetical protein
MISLISGSQTARSWQRIQSGSAFSEKRMDELGRTTSEKNRLKSGKRLCRKAKEDQRFLETHKMKRKLCQKVKKGQNAISKVKNGHKFIRSKKWTEC